MITEKRTRKPPETFQVVEKKPPRKEKQVEKKRKVTGCDFELIPVPEKYQDPGETYLLAGNFPLRQKEDECSSNLSMLNEFHFYRGLYTAEYEGQKMVVIKTERRPGKKFPRWKTLIKRMSQGGKKSKELGKTFKQICLGFEAQANDYVTKVNTMSQEKNGKEKIAALKAKMDNKKRNLFMDHPYINFRSSFRGYQTELNEIIVNERFLLITGFTVETFASTVLAEGLPPLLTMRLEEDADVMQNASNYVPNQENNHLHSPIIDFCLHTRSNYIKEAKVYIDILVNHEDSEYKSDLIFTVIDHNCPFSLPPIYKGEIFTKEFIDLMLGREREMEEFFKYIQTDIRFPKFSNKHLICKIKELKCIKDEEEEKEPTKPSDSHN